MSDQRSEQSDGSGGSLLTSREPKTPVTMEMDVDVQEPPQHEYHEMEFETSAPDRAAPPTPPQKPLPSSNVAVNLEAITKNKLFIQAPSVHEPWDYVTYEEPTVTEVLKEIAQSEITCYVIELSDGVQDIVSFYPSPHINLNLTIWDVCFLFR